MNKIAFVHVVRTAGSFVNQYFSNNLAYNVKNSWDCCLRRDWTPEELLSFIGMDNTFVHNHVPKWPEEVIDQYKQHKWFLFSFVRSPGDQICSYYFRLLQVHGSMSMTLDQFVKMQLVEPNQDILLPSYWDRLDYVNEFNEFNFRVFMKKYFDHDYVSSGRVNHSENKGWKHYCGNGMISTDTSMLLNDSVLSKRYIEIVRRNNVLML